MDTKKIVTIFSQHITNTALISEELAEFTVRDVSDLLMVFVHIQTKTRSGNCLTLSEYEDLITKLKRIVPRPLKPKAVKMVHMLSKTDPVISDNSENFVNQLTN